MNREHYDALLRDVGRDVVAEIAPEELPIFAAVSSAYLANPSRPVSSRSGANTLLGFGAEAASALATTAVLYVISEVLKVLGEAAKKAVTEGLAKEGTALVISMFKRFEKQEQPPVAPVLVDAQLPAIEATIIRAGREMQLPEQKIDALVKSVCAQLARKD